MHNVWIHDDCYGEKLYSLSEKQGIRRGRGRLVNKNQTITVQSDQCKRTVEEHFNKIEDLYSMEEYTDMGYYYYGYDPVE